MSRHRPDVHGADAGTPIDTRAAADEQDAFWRRSFRERDYTDAERGYDYSRPAYRFGWQWAREAEGDFPTVESRLRERWEGEESGLSWDEALPAIRDAYQRASNTDLAEPGNPLV